MVSVPGGLQVIGSYNSDECTALEMEIAIETKNGAVKLKNGGGSIDAESKTFSCYWGAEAPLVIEDATAVIVNGVPISIE